jgi:putative transposase
LDKRLQRQGIRLNRSARYRAYVRQLRGWIESEIGRVMNRLVQTHAPASIVTELLDFRAPGLSRRLNRLIGAFGKHALQAKLLDLEQRFGIELVKVNPAYSSQQCNRCGYVDKRNRPKAERVPLPVLRISTRRRCERRPQPLGQTLCPC